MLRQLIQHGKKLFLFKIARIAPEWLPSLDSNQGKRIQSPLCYRYTTRQLLSHAEGRDRTDMKVAFQRFLRPSRLPIPPLRLTNPLLQAIPMFEDRY